MRMPWACLAALLVLILSGTAWATDKGQSLKYGGGGLGTVIFDGRVHVGKGYVCVDCHDDLFMTKKQALVRMPDHFSDTRCFKCHDNKTAPKDCVTCHRDVRSSNLVSSDYMRDLMARSGMDEAERSTLLSGRNGVSEQSRACLNCHGNPDLKPVTERGATLNLFVRQPAYGAGAHGALPCAACHYGLAGEDSFTTQPHALAQPNSIDCQSCHLERLADEVAAFNQSAHTRRINGHPDETPNNQSGNLNGDRTGGLIGDQPHAGTAARTGRQFACLNCHNVHSQPQAKDRPDYAATVLEYNHACLSCHANPARFSEWSDKPFTSPAANHAFLTKFQAHSESVLCADCHSPTVMGRKTGPADSTGAALDPIPGVIPSLDNTDDRGSAAPVGAGDADGGMGRVMLGNDVHRILGKELALRDCSACHRDMDSLIVSRVALRDGNTEALQGSYIPALKPTGPLDRAGGWALVLVLALIGLHGAARLFGRKDPYKAAHRSATDAALHPGEVIYPLAVRVLHWINAACFIVLIWTGLGIRFEGLTLTPGLEWASHIHNTVAYVLIANFAVFLVYAMVTGDIRQYLPKGPGVFGRILVQARYYLYGIFTGAEKPYPVSRERRFNPLQQITYLVVFLLGMPVLILSGVLLLLPEHMTSGLASRDCLAALHYGLAILYGLFLAAHLYLSTTGDGVFSLIKGMITGRHEHR